MNTCPISLDTTDIITLAHGSGGKETSRLIESIFLSAFDNPHLAPLHDGATLNIDSNRIALSTDSFVIQPLFFPGGNIGKLAVIGTANDLAMCGARPLYLCTSFIIEEGLPQETLRTIVCSMKEEAENEGVMIVTGDTKVIERQTGNNLFITTTGLGLCRTEYPIKPSQIQPGDSLIVSGDIGRHEMAILAEREKLSFSTPFTSDCAPLFPMVESLIHANIPIHCMRDATRGGLASVLVELSEGAHLDMSIHEQAIPISSSVRHATDLLGLDPLFLANEGRFVLVLPKEWEEKALALLRHFPEGQEASSIGQVLNSSPHPTVHLVTAFGSTRALHKMNGSQLPRIC